MLQNLRQIKNRIRVIDNTRKVTSAMQMISMTKLNRTEKMFFAFKPYFQKFDYLLNNIINAQETSQSPFLKKNKARDICLCVITSDSGLCGAHNINIIRFTEDFISKVGTDKVKLITIGRRGFNYFKRIGMPVLNSYIGLNGRYSDKLCDEIALNLEDLFLSQKFSEVHIAYTHFQTALIHKPSLTKFLNIERTSPPEREYIFEPDPQEILDEFIPKYLSIKIKVIILESFTAEHSARAISMKMATDNADELSRTLILLRNKVRQASITQDIMEIISSAEALKG